MALSCGGRDISVGRLNPGIGRSVLFLFAGRKGSSKYYTTVHNIVCYRINTTQGP
jgi:hypothetical protein